MITTKFLLLNWFIIIWLIYHLRLYHFFMTDYILTTYSLSQTIQFIKLMTLLFTQWLWIQFYFLIFKRSLYFFINHILLFLIDLFLSFEYLVLVLKSQINWIYIIFLKFCLEYILIVLTLPIIILFLYSVVNLNLYISLVSITIYCFLSIHLF